jgi:putative polyketide hydroxylase
VLLTDDGPGGEAWQAAAGKVAGQMSVPLECFRVGPSGDLVPEGDAGWAAAHGTGEGGAVLVRPDGFVAWRAQAPSQEPERVLAGVLQDVLRRA